MKRHTTQHESLSPSDSTPNNESNPNILLRFLTIVGNAVVGIAFLQHLYQAQEDSYDLARVTKVAAELLQEVDELKNDNEYYMKELKLYESNLVEIDEELNFCNENLNRTGKEMDVLYKKIYDFDEMILSLD